MIERGSALSRPAQNPGPFTRGGRERPAEGLGDQLLLGGEMTIEAAMRETGLLHQIRHGHAVEASLAEQRRRDVENPLPGFPPPAAC